MRSTQPKPLSEFPAELLALVGGIIAQCGGIERCMMGALAYGRDVRKVPIQKLHNSASKRNNEWLTFVNNFLPDDKEAISRSKNMKNKTDKLFEIRNTLSHSLWSNTDLSNTLWLNQAREKDHKYYFRAIPIAYGQLVQWNRASESLFKEHVEFLWLKIMNLPPERVREAFNEMEWPPFDQEERPKIGMP